MSRVVCVGDVMVDVMAWLPGPLATGSDTPARIALTGGGAAANVAAWLVAAGTQATVVGRVGADAAGREAIAGLRALGVDVAVSTDPARATGCCIVLVDPSGERTMVPSAGANAGADQADLPRLLPRAADACYVSGYSLLEPGSRAFALAALAQARERGWPVAVDAASAAPLAATGPARFAGWLGPYVLMFANEDEARVLTGSPAGAAPDALAADLAGRFGEAVVKLGAGGALWAGGGACVHVPARPVEVADTTGAGDGFAAGFLAARVGGADPAGCLASGADVAARAVQLPGARPVADAGLRQS